MQAHVGTLGAIQCAIRDPEICNSGCFLDAAAGRKLMSRGGRRMGMVFVLPRRAGPSAARTQLCHAGSRAAVC